MGLLTFFGINGVENRKSFHLKVFSFYSERANGKISKTIINSICWKIANEQHSDYCRFWRQYPKSRKRYSKFLLKDLDNPQVDDQIIHYLKSYHLDRYIEYGSILLEMSNENFLKYEKERQNFQEMF